MARVLILVLSLGALACGDKKSGPAATEPAAAEVDVEPEGEGVHETDGPGERGPVIVGLHGLGLLNQVELSASAVGSGQLTLEQIAAAEKAGVTQIVNLQRGTDAEHLAAEKKAVEELNLRYVHMPVDGGTGDGLNKDNAEKLGEILASGAPTIVHCGSGNRVGALVGLSAHYVDGKSPDEAVAIAKAKGMTSLEQMIRKVMAPAAPAP